MCKLALVCFFFFNFITELTCARWKDFNLFLKREGKTKSQPRARNSSSPRRSGSSLSEESFIIMVAKSRERSIGLRPAKLVKQTPKSSVISALEGCRSRSTAFLWPCFAPSTLHTNHTRPSKTLVASSYPHTPTFWIWTHGGIPGESEASSEAQEHRLNQTRPSGSCLLSHKRKNTTSAQVHHRWIPTVRNMTLAWVWIPDKSLIAACSVLTSTRGDRRGVGVVVGG